jgi:O-antigen/teichoic acid export membrane protein
MSEPRTGVRGIGVLALIYTTVDVAAKLSTFATTLALSHFLSSADFGAFALSASLTAVLSALLGFGLETAAGLWYFGVAAAAYRRIVFTLACTHVSLGLLCILSLECLVFPFLPEAATPPAYPVLARIAMWTGFALSVTRMPIAIWTSQQRAWSVSALVLMSAALPLLGLIAGVAARGGAVLPVLLGQLAGTIAVALLCLVVTLRMSRAHFERDVLVRALRFSVPLLPTVVAISLLGLTDRFLLEWIVGRDAVGSFHLASLVGLGVILVGLSIHKAWAPSFVDRLTRLEHTDAASPLVTAASQEEYLWSAARAEARATACLLFAVAAGAMLWADPVLRWLLPTTYGNATLLIGPVVLSAAANNYYTMQATALLYRSRTGLISLTTVIAAIANLGLDLWWIPTHGAPGAATATLLSTLLMCALTSAFAARGGRPALAPGEVVTLLGLLGILVPGLSAQLVDTGVWLELVLRIGASVFALGGLAVLGFGPELRAFAARRITSAESRPSVERLAEPR